jgi:hypothetical protein
MAEALFNYIENEIPWIENRYMVFLPKKSKGKTVIAFSTFNKR